MFEAPTLPDTVSGQTHGVALRFLIAADEAFEFRRQRADALLRPDNFDFRQIEFNPRGNGDVDFIGLLNRMERPAFGLHRFYLVSFHAATTSATAPNPLETELNPAPGRAMGRLSPDEFIGGRHFRIGRRYFRTFCSIPQQAPLPTV
ncbi:MAG: hypothetical protein KAH11_05730 [Rhodospirillales bacterium]|nr:hypothetical protein [Rhodospirillales bacterium]